MVAPGTGNAQDPPAGSQRLVYFDVNVDDSLTKVYSQRQVLTQAMAGELAQLPGLTIVDLESPDNLALQRKLNLENCVNAECRFALVNALSNVDLMLDATLKPFGDDCVFHLQIRDIRTGTVANSAFSSTPCSPRDVLQSVKTVTAGIWPVRRGETKPVVPVQSLSPARGRPGSNLYLPPAGKETNPVAQPPESGDESASPSVVHSITRWGGISAILIGGAVTAVGWSKAKQGRADYEEKGQTLTRYDDAIAEVRQGNRYQTVGGFLMAVGVSGLGLSFVLE